MSLKRVSYIVFVVILVGLSALGGAVVSGWAVYRAIGTQSPPPSTTSLGVISPTTEVVSVNSTEFQTSVTQAAEIVSFSFDL